MNILESRPSKGLLPGGTKTDIPLASGALVETCIACLCSNQYIDKTVTTIKFRNRSIVTLATGLHKLFGRDYRKT